MIMSGDVSERRFEIVASARRRWNRKEKLAIVEEASGACTNVSAVARRHGLNPALLYRWKKELGHDKGAAAALLPVALVPGPSADEPVAAPTHGKDRIEIVLCNGRRVCVSGAIDAGTLKRIVLMLEI